MTGPTRLSTSDEQEPKEDGLSYLDYGVLESFDPREFQHTSPYPFLNPVGVVREEAFRRLVATLPDTSIMQPSFNVARKHGQAPHDRWALEYDDRLPVSEEWKAFVSELRGRRYRSWLKDMLGRHTLRLSFHWHYAPARASVSPHCDSPRKLGSHIFYFNDPDTWDPAWGGETVVLDDSGRLPTRSAPKWEDFDRAITAEATGNRSLLFARRGNSWHGVRPLLCPEGRMRKVFIAVLNDPVRSLPFFVQQKLMHRSAEY